MENEMTYQVIKHITNNYDKERILGSGGFGTVYKAVDEKGETIAVKVFDVPRFDDSDFRKEFDNLKRLKHKNIVELVGFCNDTEEVEYTSEDGKKIPAGKLHTALCLEYVENGHLGDYISDESKGLHWLTRYKVIKGVCEGLKYLRDGINPPILHLDLKPENILLDKDMTPKVADFGLSRFFGEEKTTKTSSAFGTIGYMPPEYTDYRVISEKFDIYSLGVIMVKIITGRENFFRIGEVPRKVFINQVQDNWKKQLRKNLTSGRSLELYCQQVRRCIEIALDCMKKNSKERPTIQDIVSSLTETETMTDNQFSHGEFIENHSVPIRCETEDIRATAIIAPAPPKQLSLDYLKKITEGFSDERIIGVNIFGTTYKGISEDGQLISVVRFTQNSPVVRDKLFDSSVQNLSALNHKNLVRIVAFCREVELKLDQSKGRNIVAEFTEILVCHEYFPAGRLANYNYGSTSTGESGLLDWDMRFKHIMGISQGLHYLHNLDIPIVYMDLTPEYIFLDNNMEPRILNYGQCRIFSQEQTRMVTHNVLGPIGYMAPEYLYRGQISSRSDIYNLGIVILEIVTGKINRTRTKDQPSSRTFIDEVKETWTLDYIRSMYTSLDDFQIHHVEMCINIGLRCADIDQKKRPCIQEIVDRLNIVSKEGEYYGMKEELVKYELLEVQPRDLCFPFEPKKPISCSLQLRNNGDDRVAFMLESETPNRYLKKLPLCGVMPHRCTYTQAITMRKQAQQKPGDLLTLHTVAVGEYDLLDVDKGSIAQEYEKYFNNAKEERHGGREVQVVTLTVNCDPLVQEQANRPTFEIITTPNALQVSSIDVHPTEPWIMTTSKGSLHVWNYKTMEILVPFKDIINDPVHVAKFIEREKWLVAGDANGGIHVYSYDEREEVEPFDAHYSSITSLAVHPTCPFLLSSSEDEDNLIKLWDWDKNWQCTRTFQGHAEKVMQVTFNSRNMGTFASASLDGTVKVWGIDEDDGDIITLDGNDGGLLCVDNFERDNRQHLVAGCMHKTAQIWNMEIKGCVQRLEGHAGRITAVNMHPELPILVTGSFDGTVRLWNSNTYQLHDIIDFNLGEVHAFAFIKDLKRMVVGCQQGMAIMEIPMRC